MRHAQIAEDTSHSCQAGLAGLLCLINTRCCTPGGPKLTAWLCHAVTVAESGLAAINTLREQGPSTFHLVLTVHICLLCRCTHTPLPLSTDLDTCRM